MSCSRLAQTPASNQASGGRHCSVSGGFGLAQAGVVQLALESRSLTNEPGSSAAKRVR